MKQVAESATYGLSTVGHKTSLPAMKQVKGEAILGISLSTGGHSRGPLVSLTTSGHPGPETSLMTSGCPEPSPETAALRQVFDARQLDLAACDIRTGAIVHHGSAIPLPDFELLHSHIEIVSVFARRGSRAESIPLSTLIDALVSEKTVPGTSSPILRHAGHLNRRALRFAFEQIGVRIGEPRKSTSFGSYAKLADAGTRCTETLMVGLRGRNIGRADIAPIRLNFDCPLSRNTHARYPLQYGVHFYLRRGLSRPEPLLAYLNNIIDRLAIDNRFFSMGGGVLH